MNWDALPFIAGAVWLMAFVQNLNETKPYGVGPAALWATIITPVALGAGAIVLCVLLGAVWLIYKAFGGA